MPDKTKLYEKSLVYKQEVYVEIADKVLDQIINECEMTALDFKNFIKVLKSRGLDRAKL